MIRRISPRSEDGFVVVLSIVVLLIGILLAGAVITQVTSTEGTVRRDGSSKRALQAARAGIDAAVWLTVAKAGDTWAPNTCPSKNGTAIDAVSFDLTVTGAAANTPTKWCPEATVQLGTNESVTYRMSTPYMYGTSEARDIIAVGSVTKGTGASGSSTAVTRRVRQRIIAGTRSPFVVAGVIALNDITLDNHATIGSEGSKVNVLAGGDIYLNHPNTEICGNATPGPGSTVSGPGSVCGTTTPATEPPTLGEPIFPSSNDNAQLSALFSNANGTCPSMTTACKNSTYVSRYLRMGGPDKLTLTGNNYVLCGLKLSQQSGVHFVPTPGNESTPIRVYIDDPAVCGNPSTPIEFAQNTTITTTSTYPIHLYVKGSPTSASNVVLGNSTVVFAAVFAPNSTVTLENNIEIRGAIAAKDILMENSSELGTDPTVVVNAESIGKITATGPTSYVPETFVECTSSTAADPSTGC